MAGAGAARSGRKTFGSPGGSTGSGRVVGYTNVVGVEEPTSADTFDIVVGRSEATVAIGAHHHDLFSDIAPWTVPILP